MAKEDFNQVSSSFETVQCIFSSILCPSIFRQIAAILMALCFSASLQADVTRKNVCRQTSKLGFRPLA
jgi:hypothetical protein